jgi:large subunit ribosomal protein L4
MDTITLPVFNTEGKEVDSITLDNKVFDGIINSSVIWQAITAYRANQRKGLASTKTRGEVSGGGKKPWKQKGTGRARVGSTRSPLWRHGGVVFGPHPRDFSIRLPQKIKEAALRSCLNSKVKDNNLIVLDSLTVEKPKTKEMIKTLSNLKIDLKKVNHNNVLVLLDKIEKVVRLSCHNIDFVNLNLAKETFAYEVLHSRKIIITKDGLAELTKRLKK